MIKRFRFFLNLIAFSSFLFLSSCEEFYEEEFTEEDSQNELALNNTYQTTLVSSDPDLTELTGQSEVRIENGMVAVNLSLNGIPQNINQIHYGYSNSPCNLLNTVIADDGADSSRSYNVSESLTTEALGSDLQSSAGDTNIDGKSFVVKAFSGANVINLACGQLSVSDVGNGETDGGVEGGTLGGTVGGTVGGTLGGVDDGTGF